MDDQNDLREIIRQQVELTGDLVRDAMSGIKAEFQVMIDACRKPHEPTFGDMAASFGLIARVALLTELALCPNEGRRIAAKLNEDLADAGLPWRLIAHTN
jgi:hypothetical protein